VVKLLGSLCILSAGGWIWWSRLAERKRRERVLQDLMAVLRYMKTEIRLARTPLPILLEYLSKTCQSDTARLLTDTAKAVREGEHVQTVWQAGAGGLPLSEQERAELRMLNWRGDDENICAEISRVLTKLEQSAAELERNGPEDLKRGFAVCFSGAMFLVILLI